MDNKENNMSDWQFKNIIKMVIDVLKGCKDINEAIAKLEKYLEK